MRNTERTIIKVIMIWMIIIIIIIIIMIYVWKVVSTYIIVYGRYGMFNNQGE